MKLVFLQTKKTLPLIIGALLLALLAFGTLPVIKVIAVTKQKKPHNVAIYSRQALEGFVISYTHSVNKGRVHDYYVCQKDGTLKVDKTVFVSYGAGIMEPQESNSAVFSSSKDGYTIAGINRKMKKLFMAVGVVAQHSFSVGGQEVQLKDVFGVQTGIEIAIKRISLLRYLFRKNPQL